MSAERPDLTFPENSNKKPDINIAYCPERVLPGKILKELITNDRIIGGMTSTCSSKASSLYKIFVKADCIKTNSKTAEMAKLTENSSRDVEIAFANELSIICDELDINVWELISLANRHPRVNILKPGPGVGGHCIAVDPWFIVSSAPENSNLIKCARKVNDFKPEYVLKKIEDEIRNFLKENPKKNIKDLKIGCFGLAFKQDIDDLRESPALAIALELAARYPSQVVVSEPNIKNLPDKVNPLLKLLLYSECYEDSDIKVLLVAHKEFLNSVKPDKYFIDCVGAWT